MLNKCILSGSRKLKREREREREKRHAHTHTHRISEPTQHCHKTAVSGFIPGILFMASVMPIFIRNIICYFRTVSSNYAVRQTKYVMPLCMELQSFEIHEGIRINQRGDWHMPSA